jgi:hypothetical protein
MEWDKIQQLLEIVELSRGHPQLKAIHDAALDELSLHANPSTNIEEEEDEE